MITCPYCNSQLAESSQSCPNCQMDSKKVSNLLGPPPFLDAAVTDFTGNLTVSQQKRIRRAIFHYNDRLPQCQFACVLRTFPENIPLRTSLFWVFNSGAISNAESKSGENRDILLAIDPTNNKAGIIIGYGLEPFISQQEIDHILKNSQPLLEKRNFTQATLNIIKDYTHLLEQKSKTIPTLFGLESMSQNTIGQNDY